MATPLSHCSVLSTPLTDSDADSLASILKALADPVRLRLLNVVAMSGERCACDFPEIVGKSQPTVSHHLTQLVNAGILHREQRGKWAWFSIDETRFKTLNDALACC